MAIAWGTMCQDIIQLVCTGVENSLSFPVGDGEPVKEEKDRQMKLAGKWSKLTNILDHGEALNMLIHAVVTDLAQVINGPLGMDAMRVSYSNVAENLWTMSTGGPDTIAPAVAGGSFPAVIKVAIDHLCELKPPSEDIMDETYIVEFLKLSMEQSKIHYLPWYPTNVHGCPCHKPQYVYWAVVSKPMGMLSIPISSVDPSQFFTLCRQQKTRHGIQILMQTGRCVHCPYKSCPLC